MPNADEAGYATPAATVISLALAMVAAAVVSRSLAEFRLAKQDFEKSKIELELAAAQNAAVLAIATSSQPPPYRWVLPSLGEAISVLAEPEFSKVGLALAGDLDPSSFGGFGVADPAALTARLKAQNGSADVVWVADDDSAPAWRNCASSYISQFGYAGQLTTPVYREPISGKMPGAWRSGEVWRIVVANQQGWREERIVRFTGNGLDPAAIVGRRVHKANGDFSRCETLLG